MPVCVPEFATILSRSLCGLRDGGGLRFKFSTASTGLTIKNLEKTQPV